MAIVEQYQEIQPGFVQSNNLVGGLLKGFIADCRRYTPPVAVLRAARASRLLGMADIGSKLMQNAAFRQHLKLMGIRDEFFFLSHRHFLARGLTARERAECALFHYNDEISAHKQKYFEKVYRGDGLLLWNSQIEDNEYEIRLMAGNDVLHEGGISIVFHVNGSRVCVVSYSTVPSRIFLPALTLQDGEPPQGDGVIFVTRKHLSTNSGYQKAFNKAFDRTTPAHLCFGALAGVAMVKGHNRFVGIEPEVHPSCAPQYERHFKVAYTDFWQSLFGRSGSPYGTIVELPLKFTPVDELEQKVRKRAILRRLHIQAVQESAVQAMAG